MDTRMSPYAPIRLRDQIWWTYSVHQAKSGTIMRNGTIALQLPDMIYNDLVMPMLQHVASELRDDENAGEIMGELSAVVFELRHWVPIVGQYELCGRQIFDMGDELVEMLSHTDFGDCSLENWHPPYDAFFIRFGKREDMKVEWDEEQGFEYIDGAFIAVTPWSEEENPDRRIKIGFTTVKESGEGIILPGHYIDFLPNEEVLPITDAIQAALVRRLNTFKDSENDEQENIVNAYRRQRIENTVELLKQATALLVNSLFYLESVGHKKGETLQPGRDTPTKYDAEWAQTRSDKRKNLKSRLTRDGYALVYLLGNELSPGGATRSQSSKSIHWRRGHWRLQPYGPKNSLTKRIWIKPVMVGTDGFPVEDTPGHIYITDGDSGNKAH